MSELRATVLSVRELAVALPAGADRVLAVEHINFDVGAGEIVCLLGESGSGKSVISFAVMGLLPDNVQVSAGEVLLGDTNLLTLTPAQLRELRGDEIAMIFQEPMTALNPVMTCGAQLDELLSEHTALSAAERRAKTLAMFEAVKLPEPDRIFASYPHQLSGGQRQRIMIAMALILEPKLLIADEPTTALDVTTQAEVLALIKTLQRERGTAVLFITHDMGVVAEIADRVVVLQQGKQVESGAKHEVLQSPREDYTRMLIAAVPPIDPPELHHHFADAPALQVHKLCKTYSSGGWLQKRRETRAATLVSFDVRPGETVGIVGESGSGKSVMSLSLLRLIPEPPGRIVEGAVEFDGVDLLALPAARMPDVRGKDIAMIFQEPMSALNPVMTVGEQISEAIFLHEKIGAAARRARVLEMLQLVGIPDAGKRSACYPHEFSGGMRQRVLIAMALIGRPDLLIADEPTTALDVSVQAQVLRILFDMVRKHNLAVLLITHNLGVVAQLCTHVAVMYAGNIIETGRVESVLTDPRHPYTRALLAAAPGAKMKRGELEALGGSVPNLITPPPGCRFAPRCAQAMPRCDARTPPMIPIGADHGAACLLFEQAARAAE